MSETTTASPADDPSRRYIGYSEWRGRAQIAEGRIAHFEDQLAAAVAERDAEREALYHAGQAATFRAALVRDLTDKLNKTVSHRDELIERLAAAASAIAQRDERIEALQREEDEKVARMVDRANAEFFTGLDHKLNIADLLNLPDRASATIAITIPPAGA